MTTEQLLNQTIQEMNSLKADALREQIKQLHATANSRLRTLRKIAGEPKPVASAVATESPRLKREKYIPSLEALEKNRSQDFKFSDKELAKLNVNQLRAEFAFVKGFLTDKTSTAKGYKSWQKAVDERNARVGVGEGWTMNAQETWQDLLRDFMTLNQNERYLQADSKLYHELKEYVQKIVKGFDFERDKVTTAQMDIWRSKLQDFVEKQKSVRYRVIRTPDASQDYLKAFGIEPDGDEAKSGSNLGRVAYNFSYDYNGRYYKSKAFEKQVKENIRAAAGKKAKTAKSKKK